MAAIGRPATPPEQVRRQQEAFLAAFARTGLASRAAREAGFHPPKHYSWLKDDPDYAGRFAELEKQTRDLARASRRPRPRGYRVQGNRADARRANQEKVLAALAECGIILQAAREAGISAATYHQWFKDESWFRERAEKILRDTQSLRREILAERLGKASRIRWDDPGRREAWSEFQRTSWTPEKREAASRRSLERYADPEARAAWEAANAAARRTPEARARYAEHAERMKELWTDPEYRRKVIAASQTPESRRLRSEATKKQWAALSPEERAEKLRTMRRAFKGGHKLTSIEADVMSALNERELPYLAHKPIEGYIADIYIPSIKLIIECDGAWFHSQRRDSDEERDAALESLGYRTLRLSEAEIKARDWTRLDEMISRLSTDGSA